jgi:Arc/MetJ-type ribon-helix-helix transcriptional regulator
MTQIAVKLPDELVAEVDRLVSQGSFASRSQAVRSSIEAMVARRRRDEIDAGYRDAFARVPESEQELADARRLSLESIQEESWDRWW